MKGKETSKRMSFLSSVDWRVGAFAVLRRPNGNVSWGCKHHVTRLQEHRNAIRTSFWDLEIVTSIEQTDPTHGKKIMPDIYYNLLVIVIKHFCSMQLLTYFPQGKEWPSVKCPRHKQCLLCPAACPVLCSTEGASQCTTLLLSPRKPDSHVTRWRSRHTLTLSFPPISLSLLPAPPFRRTYFLPLRCYILPKEH